MNDLIPVIKEIENEFKVNFFLYNNGCTVSYGLDLNYLIEEISSFDLPNWSNNVFRVIVKYLESK